MNGNVLGALCAGTQVAPYALWVSCVSNSNTIVGAHCSCPVGRGGMEHHSLLSFFTEFRN